jgi:hypothetical protein
MAESQRNVLIANGKELIGQLSWPRGGGKKWMPYGIQEARTVLHSQLVALGDAARQVPPLFAPRKEITARVTLHPVFLAKSYFPAALLREVGLTILGSRPERVAPRTVREKDPKEAETVAIFASGTAGDFQRMDERLLDPRTASGLQEQFARIEQMHAYGPQEKLRLRPDSRWPDYAHVTLHANETDTDIIVAFREAVEALGGRVLPRGFRSVTGLTFAAIQMDPSALATLAQFTRVRLIRSLPQLSDDESFEGAIARSRPAPLLPTVGPVSTARAAIFDGGTANAFGSLVSELAPSSLAATDPEDLAHGIHVTSAFLFGPVPPDQVALPVPYCAVEHHRVLPSRDSPDQALDVLDRIVSGLKVARTAGNPYRFANISLGPRATFFDDDVHEWTSRLDEELANGQTLCTAAVGNNGLLDAELGRIQPPGDAVNIFAIGAADSTAKEWARAPYSAKGPGRSPGYVKPDAVAFGGSASEPLPVFNPLTGGVVAVGGTSIASPLALRVAAGVDAHSRGTFDPVTLQALMLNACDFSTRHHDRVDVGWGRLPLNPEAVLYTDTDAVRIVYQGITRPGHPQKAVIPVPTGLPSGSWVHLGATFCYRAPVDPAHAINYTRAGLWVRCYKAPKKSLPLFGSGMYKTEAELRKDSMRWDTVLSAKRKIRVDDLDSPYFHINYQVRDEGEAIRPEDALPMPYALVVTIQAPGVNDLLARIQAQYPVLQTLEVAPGIESTVRT